MATKTSTQITQELNDLLSEDTVNAAPWTAAVKQRALNRAIRGSWPYFKVEKKDESVTLVANTFIYSLAAITDIQSHGLNRVYLEPVVSTQDWAPLRRVEQRKANDVWYLYVPESIVSYYAGQKLRLHYYTAPTELTFAGTDTLDERFVNYVVYTALVELFQIAMVGGSDFNVDTYAALIPQYRNDAAAELKKNLIMEQTALVGLRSEAYA